jgi:hypothetical protein
VLLRPASNDFRRSLLSLTNNRRGFEFGNVTDCNALLTADASMFKPPYFFSIDTEGHT